MARSMRAKRVQLERAWLPLGIRSRPSASLPWTPFCVAAIGPTRSRQAADCCPRGTECCRRQAIRGIYPLTNTGIYPNIHAVPENHVSNPQIQLRRMPCHATALRKAARRVTQMYEDALARRVEIHPVGDPARAQQPCGWRRPHGGARRGIGH